MGHQRNEDESTRDSNCTGSHIVPAKLHIVRLLLRPRFNCGSPIGSFFVIEEIITVLCETKLRNLIVKNRPFSCKYSKKYG